VGLFRRQRREAEFLEETFGDELAAKLIDHLGVEGAATFAESTVAEARARWVRFRDMDSLSEEEHQEMDRKAAESGTVTIATRAVFMQEFMAQRVLREEASEELLQTADKSGTDDPDERLVFIGRFVAEKIAGDVASEAMKKANLPEDRDLHLDLGARIYLVLVPMRIG